MSNLIEFLKNNLLIIPVLALVTLVLGQALQVSFIPYDDNMYVYGNAVVKSGLTSDSLKWIFSNRYYENYAPLTLLSHIIDIELFGLSARKHHLSSILLHLANVLLVYSLLLMLGFNKRLASLASAIFGLHPINVQAVAWLSSRKDLLASFFGLLSIISYLHYLKESKRKFYRYSLISFIFAILSKTNVAPIGILLIAIDWLQHKKLNLVSKLPYLLISIVLILGQASNTATRQEFSLVNSIINSAYYYLLYIIKYIWPSNLSLVYDIELNIIKSLTSLIVLLLFSLYLIYNKRLPRLALFGWFWFILFLALYVQIFPAGTETFFDRWIYLSQIGLLILFCILCEKLKSPSSFSKKILAIVLTITLAILSYTQIYLWKNPDILFLNATIVAPKNSTAERLRGVYKVVFKKHSEALKHFKKAVEINPNDQASIAELAQVKEIVKKQKESQKTKVQE